MERQLNLFERPGLNIQSRLKAAIREALRECKLSREQVADRMTEIAKIEGLRPPGNAKAISKSTLDKWAGEAGNHHIPLSILPIFCSVTGSDQPLKVLTAPLGLKVINNEESKLLEWARAERRRRKATKQAKRLAEEAGL